MLPVHLNVLSFMCNAVDSAYLGSLIHTHTLKHSHIAKHTHTHIVVAAS